mgnify:CR=1 FL=1
MGVLESASIYGAGAKAPLVSGPAEHGGSSPYSMQHSNKYILNKRESLQENQASSNLNFRPSNTSNSYLQSQQSGPIPPNPSQVADLGQASVNRPYEPHVASGN